MSLARIKQNIAEDAACVTEAKPNCGQRRARGGAVRWLARRLGVRRRLIHITRFGDSPNPFVPFDWEPDPRGELR